MANMSATIMCIILKVSFQAFLKLDAEVMAVERCSTIYNHPLIHLMKMLVSDMYDACFTLS